MSAQPYAGLLERLERCASIEAGRPTNAIVAEAAEAISSLLKRVGEIEEENAKLRQTALAAINSALLNSDASTQTVGGE